MCILVMTKILLQKTEPYGQLLINGNGYTGFVSLDQNAMWVGHNSEIRDLHLDPQMKLLT